LIDILYSFFRRRGPAIILSLVLICSLATHTTFQSEGVRATDDNLIFYLNGLNVFHGAALGQLNDRAIRFYTEKGADPHAMLRLKLHKVSLNEFALPGMLYYAISRILKPLFDPAPGIYPIFITQSLVFGFFVTFALTLLLFTGVFVGIRALIFTWALGLTVGLYGLSEFLPLQSNSYATILMHDSLGGIFAHSRDLLLRPGTQFSPLAFTPRSHVTLLLIGLFALRWRRQHAAAYGLLFVLSFYHLSASGLLIVMLVGIDLLVRPEIFRVRSVGAIASLTTALFLYRENMWEFLLGRGLTALIMVGIALLVGVGLIMVPAVRKKLSGATSVCRRIQRLLVARGAIAADLILIVTAWIVSVIAIYFLIQTLDLKSFAGWSEAFYFWGRVNGRIMTLLMPSIVFGCFVLTLARLARSNRFAIRRLGHVAMPIIIGVIALAVVSHSVQVGAKTKVLSIVAGGFFKAEHALDGSALPQLKAMGFSETLLYYGFSKSVDGHPRQLDALLP
jgi:hypothetical protein